MNTKNISLLFTFLLLFSLSLTAQNLKNFEQLVSEGEIPKEFVSSSSSKYKSLEKKVKGKKKAGKKQKKFYLESSFAIDQLLKSGQVLFGDPVSKYVNSVADKLLEHEPKLRKKLRFYVVKSAGVNAFATDRGSIFVNLGLISRLENEAQLAFVLAHEIIHYKHRHNMDSFLEYQEIESIYRREKSYDKLLKKSNYSQKLEKEADEEGMEIFADSPYGTSTLPYFFEILGTAHTAYSDVEFDKSYLEIYDVSIPDSLLLDTLNTIKKYMDSEELSSHPSLSDRKTKMEERFGTEGKDKPNFILSEDEFNTIRDLSRFEICNVLVENRSFSAAIYYSYALSKEYGSNKFIEGIKAKSLYGLAQYANENKRKYLPSVPDSIQGNMQQSFHILNKLEPVEISALATAHLWEYHIKYPKDESFRLRTKDMIVDLNKHHIDKKDDFFKVKPKENEPFVKGMFANVYNHTEFKKYVNEGSKQRNKFKKLEHKLEYLEQFTKGYDKKEATKIKKGVALKKDKILFINPMYMRINKAKKVPVRYIESESQQEVLVDKIKEVAKKQKLKTEILDVNSLSKRSSSTEFNETVVVNSWVDEFWQHDVEMIPSNHGKVLELTEKYGTDAIAYTGVLSYSRRTLGPALLYSYLFLGSGYLTPLAYQMPVMNKHTTTFFWVSFDVKELKVLHSEINSMKMKSADLVLETNLYWMMEQVKRKR